MPMLLFWDQHTTAQHLLSRVQTAASVQEQVRTAAAEYMKQPDQPLQQSPPSDSTASTAQASTASSSKPEDAFKADAQQQQQQQTQQSNAGAAHTGTESENQSRSREGQTSTSSAGNQQSSSKQQAAGTKPEGLMYRLRSLGQTVRKEVCRLDLSCAWSCSCQQADHFLHAACSCRHQVALAGVD